MSYIASALQAPTISPTHQIEVVGSIPELRHVVWLPLARQCVFNSWTIPEYIELWCKTDDFTDVHGAAKLCVGSQFSFLSFVSCVTSAATITATPNLVS